MGLVCTGQQILQNGVGVCSGLYGTCTKGPQPRKSSIFRSTSQYTICTPNWCDICIKCTFYHDYSAFQGGWAD